MDRRKKTPPDAFRLVPKDSYKRFSSRENNFPPFHFSASILHPLPKLNLPPPPSGPGVFFLPAKPGIPRGLYSTAIIFQSFNRTPGEKTQQGVISPLPLPAATGLVKWMGWRWGWYAGLGWEWDNGVSASRKDFGVVLIVYEENEAVDDGFFDSQVCMQVEEIYRTDFSFRGENITVPTSLVGK